MNDASGAMVGPLAVVAGNLIRNTCSPRRGVREVRVLDRAGLRNRGDLFGRRFVSFVVDEADNPG